MAKPELLFDSTVLIDLYRGQAALRPFFDALLASDLIGYMRDLHLAQCLAHEANFQTYRLTP